MTSLMCVGNVICDVRCECDVHVRCHRVILDVRQASAVPDENANKFKSEKAQIDYQCENESIRTMPSTMQCNAMQAARR